MKERLQKILARAGHGSRRHCETLITAGRVRVNGEAATLGSQADAGIDQIQVDGTLLVLESPTVYLAMNKPHGVLTTASDPQGRRTVMELLPPGLPPHIFQSAGSIATPKDCFCSRAMGNSRTVWRIHGTNWTKSITHSSAVLRQKSLLLSYGVECSSRADLPRQLTPKSRGCPTGTTCVWTTPGCAS